MSELWEDALNDYESGMKYKEIAEKYGVSLNTVKSWKTRHWNKKSVHTKNEVGSLETRIRKEVFQEIKKQESMDSLPSGSRKK